VLRQEVWREKIIVNKFGGETSPFDTDAKAAGAYRYMGCAVCINGALGTDFLIVQTRQSRCPLFLSLNAETGFCDLKNESPLL
jgi:hypothetical protein